MVCELTSKTMRSRTKMQCKRFGLCLHNALSWLMPVQVNEFCVQCSKRATQRNCQTVTRGTVSVCRLRSLFSPGGGCKLRENSLDHGRCVMRYATYKANTGPKHPYEWTGSLGCVFNVCCDFSLKNPRVSVDNLPVAPNNALWCQTTQWTLRRTQRMVGFPHR